jgi:hypothetical protein
MEALFRFKQKTASLLLKMSVYSAVPARMCLPISCLAMNFSDFIIPAFGRHVMDLIGIGLGGMDWIDLA